MDPDPQHCFKVNSGRELQCLKIIRLEFASLWELCSILTDLVRRDDLLMPMGSAILIGSASHLSKVGISAYCEELVAVSKRLQCTSIAACTSCHVRLSSPVVALTRSW